MQTLARTVELVAANPRGALPFGTAKGQFDPPALANLANAFSKFVERADHRARTGLRGKGLAAVALPAADSKVHVPSAKRGTLPLLLGPLALRGGRAAAHRRWLPPTVPRPWR
jgi:hypothetical protein